ncbi:hypothetical protein K402DRAFT_405496 [Aulographum hederae CBS 113979]|uniref:Uncharacterized protein n=1 Tax=Aulographum hederae CBS 113979 TaxID=1176131 RepID=A0A6G1GW74_9PEZI|nr:hypothetical protein K402DRAFT_405496 [Aulographum hederae CBS 113979]
MRYSFIAALPLLSLPFALAVCDESTAQMYGASSSSSTDACSQQCGSDQDCLTTCLDLAMQGQCNSVGCGDDTDTSSDGTTDDGDLIKKRKQARSLRKRDYECGDDETCYINPANDILFCLDDSTGDYNDAYGGTGNVNTGVYDGPVNDDGTIASTIIHTTPAGASAAASTGSGSGSGSGASATSRDFVPASSTGGASGSGSPTGSAAAESTTNAAQKLAAGALAAVAPIVVMML